MKLLSNNIIRDSHRVSQLRVDHLEAILGLEITKINIMNDSLVGKYLVSKWGYSMILATWVKVISETPKTLLVKEVRSRHTTPEEDVQKGLTYGWLQNYSMPTDTFETRNGAEQKAFRVYKRTLKAGTVVTKDGPTQKFVDTFVGCTPGSNMKHYFELWDGEPEFEDHCD